MNLALVKKKYTVVLSDKSFFMIEVTVVTRMFKKPEVYVESLGGYPVRFNSEKSEW